MPATTIKNPRGSDEPRGLPLPNIRCLSKEQAATYLGIGVTLLEQIGPVPVKFGRRSVYDLVDLDEWLDDYKNRGRVRKETLWPVKQESTGGEIRPTGGSTLSYRTADAYAKALGLKTETKRKQSSQS